MKKYSYLLLCLLLVACDMRDKSYVIQGILPNTDYDNEYIYLVPINNPTVETVDSTLVKDGQFCFFGAVDTAEIRIIRTRPILRLTLQELLVVVEPGQIQVELDSVSSCSGTLLNDELQCWKEQKMKFETEVFYLKSAKDEPAKGDIEDQLLAVNKRYADFNYNFVQKNYANVLGKFIFSMMGFSMTDEQRYELSSLIHKP